jgi:8-oxo-dGTP diphosphatase
VTDAATGSSVPRSRTSVGASALVLRGDELLMVRQVRRTGVRWEVPGGGQEAGETLEETAARETAEEAGVGIVVEGLVCTYSSVRLHAGTIVLGAFYVARPTDPDVVPRPQIEEGITEAAWVDPSKLDEDELGPLTRRTLLRWWSLRSDPPAPFHVELWRDRTGYLSEF